MTNIRNTWEDLPSKNTPINAERLNNLEQNAGKGADFVDNVSQLGKNLTVAASAEEARALIGATEAGHNHILASNNFAGFMSTSDKVKLDGLSNYTLPAATTSAIGGVLKATGVEDTTGEDLQALKTTVNELLANLRAAGIMY